MQNKNIISVLKTGGSDADETLRQFDAMLRSGSPVGSMEIRSQLAQFSYGYLSALAQQGATLTPESLNALATFSNQWFDGAIQNQEPLSSKELYLIGLFTMRAAFSANDEDTSTEYLEKAKQYFEYGLSQAETRVEFVIQLLQIATLQNDEEQKNALMLRLQELRPDDFQKLLEG